MLKFRELIAAGAFVQRAGTAVPSSFTGLVVGSAFSGNSTIRGIATMNSGTTVVSVAATGVVSGNVILSAPIQYADAQTTVTSGSQFFIGVVVGSVRTGAFEIFAIGSRAPISDLPIGWFRIN